MQRILSQSLNFKLNLDVFLKISLVTIHTFKTWTEKIFLGSLHKVM